jgi:hypothetical protein
MCFESVANIYTAKHTSQYSNQREDRLNRKLGLQIFLVSHESYEL